MKIPAQKPFVPRDGHLESTSESGTSRYPRRRRAPTACRPPGWERAGITKFAVDVLPEGLDADVVSGGLDLGRVRRPLPVETALDDVLLADEMNGVPLPPDHGFPVPLVVPRLGRDREHQVARPHRGLHQAALLAVEHDLVPDVRARLRGPTHRRSRGSR
jgi:hypothetical protein